ASQRWSTTRSSRRASQNGCDTGVGSGRGLGIGAAASLTVASPADEDEGALLAHDAAGAAHVGGVVAAQLPLAGATLDLPHAFEHVRHPAAHPGLTHAQLPAVRVAREVAPVRE